MASNPQSSCFRLLKAVITGTQYYTWFVYLFIFLHSIRYQTLSFVHAKQVFCHWATPSALLICFKPLVNNLKIVIQCNFSCCLVVKSKREVSNCVTYMQSLFWLCLSTVSWIHRWGTPQLGQTTVLSSRVAGMKGDHVCKVLIVCLT